MGHTAVTWLSYDDHMTSLHLSFTDGLCSTSDLPHCPFLYALATTHSLATIDGELSGDPIDLKMFQGTGWVSETEAEGERVCGCVGV